MTQIINISAARNQFGRFMCRLGFKEFGGKFVDRFGFAKDSIFVPDWDAFYAADKEIAEMFSDDWR